MTAVATMKTFASEVAPTATPSIGTGKASASTEAANRAATPASVAADGADAANDHAAAAVATSPPPATGTTTDRSPLPPRETRGVRGVRRPAETSSVRAAARLADGSYQVQPSPSPATEAITAARARSFTSIPFHESIRPLLSCARAPLPGLDPRYRAGAQSMPRSRVSESAQRTPYSSQTACGRQR